MAVVRAEDQVAIFRVIDRTTKCDDPVRAASIPAGMAEFLNH